jgi:DUF2075 family protein
MIIYQNTKAGFLDDVDNNTLQRNLEEAFQKNTGSIPSDRRVWADEYARFAGPLRRAAVSDEIQVAIEYHVSSIGRSRIDVLLAGNDGKNDNGLIIELKAWDKAGSTDIEDMVLAPYGGGDGKIKQHPSLQAHKYKVMIVSFNQDIAEKGVQMHPAAYLFNLKRRDPEPLEDARYSELLLKSKLFLADDVAKLKAYFETLVPHKSKNDVLFLLDQGRWRPADELITRVESMLEGNPEFELIDEQDEAFRIIRHQVLDETDRTHRHVFVVEGGPGTGKSVIAVRLLAETLAKKRMAFFVAPNMAFREALVNSLSKGDRRYRDDGQALFKSSWSFHEGDYRKDERSEILVVDEAHRLKDQAYQYKGKSMVEDMVRSARISVFFIDEHQKVSWNDSGTVKAIEAAASKFKAQYHAPIQLTAQFRCNGSTGYLNWLDDVFQIRETGNFDNWGDSQYEFQVFDDAQDLYSALKAKNTENKARLIAGYSWDWPTKGRERGTKVKHVEADGLALPWNFTGENWASAKDGIEQVGCIHTIQGLEFDWQGVLVGDDMALVDGKVVGLPDKRAKTDKSLSGYKKELKEAKGDATWTAAVQARADLIIKSTYRVLLSRGRKGTFVWCKDKALAAYLKQRLALARRSTGNLVVFKPKVFPKAGPGLVPLYSLEVAAGAFGAKQSPEATGWVEVAGVAKPSAEHFVARVVGRSMEPLIPNDSYCLFRRYTGGSRGGKVVLAQSHGLSDPETGSSFTVKRYRSEKLEGEGHWEHGSISLEPINAEFKVISLSPSQAEEVSVVAEFVKVLTPA